MRVFARLGESRDLGSRDPDGSHDRCVCSGNQAGGGGTKQSYNIAGFNNVLRCWVSE